MLSHGYRISDLGKFSFHIVTSQPEACSDLASSRIFLYCKSIRFQRLQKAIAKGQRYYLAFAVQQSLSSFSFLCVLCWSVLDLRFFIINIFYFIIFYKKNLDRWPAKTQSITFPGFSFVKFRPIYSQRTSLCIDGLLCVVLFFPSFFPSDLRS